MVIGITLNTPTAVYPGSTLTGIVWTDTADERDIIPASGIRLRFRGKETSVVRYVKVEVTEDEDGNKERNHVIETAKEKRELISTYHELDTSPSVIVNEHLEPGHHQVPFAIQLPRNLPASVKEQCNVHRRQNDRRHVNDESDSDSDEEEQRHGSYYQVVYRLQAELIGSGVLWNYKSEKLTVQIAKPLSQEHVPYAVPPHTVDVRWMCCVPQGTMTVTTAVADTKLDRGETVTVALAARNHSSATASSVEASLVQHCEWQAERKSKTTARVLQTVQFEELEAFLAPDVDSSPNDDEASSMLQETLLREVQQGLHVCRLTMPQDAHCSCSRKRMKIEHFIEITVYTGLGVTNPVMEIPIQAGPSMPSSASATVATENSSGSDENCNGAASPALAEEDEIVLVGYDDRPVGVSQPLPSETIPSTGTLLQLMDESLEDLCLLQQLVSGASWTDTFRSLSAANFGVIVGAVSSEFEQAAAATTVAQAMGDDIFSCSHAAAAVVSCAEWSRAMESRTHGAGTSSSLL